MRNTIKTLKWISGSLEAVLGIPIVGGTIILSLAWTPLVVMLAFHIVIVVLSKKAGVRAPGNVLGIVASAIGWIPLVGMVMHILSATYTMMDAAQRPRYNEPKLIEVD